MWVDHVPVERHWGGGSVAVTEILLEFDGPVIFRAKVGLNDYLFAKRDEIDDLNYYLAVETNDEIVGALKGGRLPLRGALYQADAWLIEARLLEVSAFQLISEESIGRFLPAPNAGLLSAFGAVPDTIEQAEAFLSFRFLGASIRKGHVPLSVLQEKVNQFSNFVRKTLTPPALANGRDSRFFDVQMAEPRFSSLVLAAKKPEFDFQSISTSPRLRGVDRQQLLNEAGEQGQNFWNSLTSAADQIEHNGHLSRDFIANQQAFLDNLYGLVPSADSGLERVEITFNNGTQMQAVFLDRQAGDIIADAQENRRSDRKTIRGVIIEINGDSRTFLIKDLVERQCTCAIPWETFERLDAQGELRRGRQVAINGQFTKRTRRDYIWSDNPIVFLN